MQASSFSNACRVPFAPIVDDLAPMIPSTAVVAAVAILVTWMGVPAVGVLQDGRMSVEVTTCGDKA